MMQLLLPKNSKAFLYMITDARVRGGLDPNCQAPKHPEKLGLQAVYLDCDLVPTRGAEPSPRIPDYKMLCYL